MLRRDADRNLLFGINALQNDFITRDALIAAMNAWALEKHRPLGDILVERDALNPDDRDLLNQLIDRHLARHGGDPTASLAAMSSIGSVADDLRKKIADPDVLESIANIPTDSLDDPHATRAPETADYIPAGVRYHKVRDHAKGGLGIVFVARDNELNREVALKEIKPEYADNLDRQARFLIEAEITGGLEHPGIVPVYGLGHYDDGRPYYAMRFIRGDSLKDAISTFHADKSLKDDPGARALALQKLLRRFLDVCNAVAYAHSRGVLHRDLKPDNVMVGRYGETLVVDWGLAKAVGRSSEDGYGPLPESTLMYSSSSGSAETMPGSVIGTPSYMSPEQAAGRLDLLGPVSDVYSLGATLYTLLTGRVPFSGKDFSEILHKVERGEFPRPREASPWLDPALEAICLKSMALKPETRYPSPKALADDIERWLADEQVTAHLDPWTRRARRWAKRNRTAVSAVVASLLVGLVGLGAVAAVQTQARNDLDRKNGELRDSNALVTNSNTNLKAANVALDLQRQRAEANEAQAIAAVKKFGDVIANERELKDNPALKDLRHRLLREPLAFFIALKDRLQADQDTRPESLARLASVSFGLGQLTNEIGDKQDALSAYREALSIQQKLADANPNITRFQIEVAMSHNQVGILLRDTGKPDEALEAFGRALAIRRRLAEANPTSTPLQFDLAASDINVGNLLSETGRPGEALESHERALRIFRKLSEADPRVTEFEAALATSYVSIGLLLSATGKPGEALEAYEQSLAIRRRLAEANPKVTEFQSDLAASHNNIGNLQRKTGKPGEALEAYQQSLTIRGKLSEANPTVIKFLSDLAVSHNNIGLLLHETGQSDSALKAYERGLAIQEKLAETNPTVTEFQSNLAASHNNIGNLLSEFNRPGEALEAHERAMKIFRKLAESNPRVTEFQARLAASHANLGFLLRTSGKAVEALEAYEQSLTIQRKLSEANPTVTEFQSDLAVSYDVIGLLLNNSGKKSEAMDSYEQALVIWRNLVRNHPESHEYASKLAVTLNNEAAIYVASKRFEEARVRFREAIECQRRALRGEPANLTFQQRLATHWTGLVIAYRGLGNTEGVAEAERELAKLHDSDPAIVALDARLSAIIKGDQKPKDNPDRLQLAKRAYEKALHSYSVKFWSDAIDADPKLAEDRQAVHRYNAACAAALAACGQGKDDPAPNDKTKVELREQARVWLQAELVVWTKLVEFGPPQARAFVLETLQHWKEDTDLAGIRDEAALAKLPEGEREAFRSLWAEVEALRKKAVAGAPTSPKE